VLNISSKFRLKTPSGLGDPSIESLGLFRGLIFRGGGTTDTVQVVPMNWFSAVRESLSVVPAQGR
jgi:hypothetical protein